MDAIDRFGEALLEAGRNDIARRGGVRGRARRWSRRWQIEPATVPRLRILLVASVLLLVLAAIAVAATQTLLIGAQVRTIERPVASAGEGVPTKGGVRLLAIRAPDPAGGVPWGLRVVHTTQGQICVQVGRLYHDELGEHGIDRSFRNDGRFHPLPPAALPDTLGQAAGWISQECAAPGQTYAAYSTGVLASGASTARPRAGSADRRKISFGLLGAHAVRITYRSSSGTQMQPVSSGLGAYLIVQRDRASSTGAASETDGSDQLPYRYSTPAAPNGALVSITHRYGNRVCTDNGHGDMRPTCGLSGHPAPLPAPPGNLNEPLRVHLQMRDGAITNAEITFTAPYAVTSASEFYSVTAKTSCGLFQAGPHVDVPAGGTVSVPIERLLTATNSRSLSIQATHTRFAAGTLQTADVGSIAVHLPPGTHALSPLIPVLGRQATRCRRPR